MRILLLKHYWEKVAEMSFGSPWTLEDHSQLLDAWKLEARLWAAACKVCNQIPSKKRQGDGHFACPLCTESWGDTRG